MNTVVVVESRQGFVQAFMAEQVARCRAQWLKAVADGKSPEIVAAALAAYKEASEAEVACR